ncbi:hypothetical protein [Sphaerisporangium perillae]|uniref:hypothetical protein n=1 Tax=Sphaerisporangium perillae TaxID=2935860 RepID=UPI00200E8750|nr:hypothetical protein [Sphaerisporangium perillae]
MANGGELQRQAQEKELLAARFDNYAKDLITYFDHIKTGSVESGPVWTGPAAQRFEQDTGRHRSDVDRLIEQCYLASRNLRRMALQLRQQAEQATTTI